MFSHVMLGATDFDASRAFYDGLLGALGAEPSIVDGKGRAIWMHGGGLLLLTRPIDGQPATAANGGTIGFACSSPGQVDAWHAAGVAGGGTSVEDPPGVRESGSNPLYLAYLRDPAGNKLCGLHRLS